MEKIILQVTGMSCAHCETAVVNELTDMGATSVIASAENNTVEITYDPTVVTIEAMKAEIKDMGYILQ